MVLNLHSRAIPLTLFLFFLFSIILFYSSFLYEAFIKKE